MTLCSPRFLFRLFTPPWMVSMWISMNFRINPFMHEVNDSSICLRIYSIDAIMQSKQQNFIQTTRPTLNKLAILKWPFLLRYTTAHSLVRHVLLILLKIMQINLIIVSKFVLIIHNWTIKCLFLYSSFVRSSGSWLTINYLFVCLFSSFEFSRVSQYSNLA